MEIKDLKPRQVLNKAFLKVKPNRTEIERFKLNLIQLLDSTNDTESEEFHKNLVIDFLKKTYYDPDPWSLIRKIYATQQSGIVIPRSRINPL